MAEIDNSIARNNVTDVIRNFMGFQLNNYTKEDVTYYINRLKETNDLVTPIIHALEMEGFYHFHPPCSSNSSLKPPECYIGSSWTNLYAQKIMGNLSDSFLYNTDTFSNVVSVPEKFPSLKTNCTENLGCKVIVGTITENSYSVSNFDFNFLNTYKALINIF